jgi:hypothetical protein
MDDLKINSTSPVPQDGPLAQSLDDQTYIEPYFTSTDSMKGSKSGKGKGHQNI